MIYNFNSNFTKSRAGVESATLGALPTELSGRDTKHTVYIYISIIESPTIKKSFISFICLMESSWEHPGIPSQKAIKTQNLVNFSLNSDKLNLNL